MKPETRRRVSFIGKSMLWSLLLYVAMMLTFNWDEVTIAFKGKNSVTVITTPAAGEQAETNQRQACSQSGIRSAAIIVLRVLSGVAAYGAD